MDAQRIHAQAAAAPTTVDLAHYRSVLKNKAIVDEAEKLLNDFKPVSYDVSAQIKAIETFESKAVRRVLLSSWSLLIARPLCVRGVSGGVGREGEGDHGEDRRRAEGPPGYPREHRGCTALRRAHSTCTFVLLHVSTYSQMQ